MRIQDIQFAVVREDPFIEANIIKQTNVESIAMICSGGCSVLSLRSMFPNLNITAFDMNGAQINLFKEKLHALNHKASLFETFNIDVYNTSGLNQSGNFELLFNSFRHFIHEFIMGPNELRVMFQNIHSLKEKRNILIKSRYWAIAFELFFSNTLLEAMFGPAATQHAEEGSYAKYFQNVIEKGLSHENALNNYFLHHILLGYYFNKKECLPPYLTQAVIGKTIGMIEGSLDDVPNLAQYDLIQISNITDWMNEYEIMQLANSLGDKCKSGTGLLIRQLNNDNDLTKYFKAFKFNSKYSNELLRMDRSLFYSNILYGVKQ